MTTIRQQDFIDSVADALQFISYYHPEDYIHALADAYKREESPADLPGHRHRGGFRAGGDGCALD